MATQHTKKQLEDIITGLNTKLDSMEKSLASLKDLPNKVSNLEDLLKASNKKNAELVKAIEAKDRQIDSLTLKLNAIEQHNRGWSVRINGVELSSEEEVNVRAVKNKIYNEVLLPILTGAVQCGDLADIPPLDSVLEHAHILPARDRQTKPIIAQFTVREFRSLVFKHKKAFAPRERGPSSASPDRPGRYKYPIFEDLTKLTFTKMRAIAALPSVEACWSSGGQLRFKLKDNPIVHRVPNLLLPADKIVGNINQ